MITETVELHQAFSWICNGCGKRNFERGVNCEMSSEEFQEAKERLGVEPWVEGAMVMAPSKVKCKNCGEAYTTE